MTEAAISSPPLRLCLAASGGGHLRQILDLEPVWRKHDYVFVTEDTALGRSLAKDHPTAFLPHVAWGQVKQGAALRMLGGAVVSILRSAGMMLRQRPDVLITTGAGAVYPPVLWARLLGAEVIAFESFARFDHPSLFGRLAAPVATHFIISSQKLAARYPKAVIFDLVRILDEPAPIKEDLVFTTVGATLRFDRLVSAVAELKAEGEIPSRVVVQTGVGGIAAAGVETHEGLSFEGMQAMLRKASIVVCHGGTGSIMGGLREGCHVIVMPRKSELAEHYDDHQSEITEAFVKRGLVQKADTKEELRAALAATRHRQRIVATTESTALITHLQTLLRDIAQRRGKAV